MRCRRALVGWQQPTFLRKTTMRGKKAKALRKSARALTVGYPDVAYTGDKVGAVRLAPQCTRGAYQRLKKVAYLG